jgi:hypothetical protein
MKCWFCNEELIWQNDFMLEDFCYYNDGIVAFLICPNCGAEIYCVIRNEEDE